MSRAKEESGSGVDGDINPGSVNGPMDLREAQRRVDAWIGQFEEGYWPPLTNLARLVEEVGELARILNHEFGHKPKKPEEPAQDLAEELADVLYVILVLANERDIDLDAALRGVMEKYRERDADRWTRKGGRKGDRKADRKADRTERREE